MRFLLSTLKKLKTIELQVVTYRLNSMHMLQIHALSTVHTTDTRAFDAFSTVHTNTRYTRFHFDPVLRTFSSLCFFDENAQRICVDGALVMFIQTVEYYGLVNL